MMSLDGLIYYGIFNNYVNLPNEFFTKIQRNNMPANKVTFNNVGDVVLVQCSNKDVVGFISDLKSNLDNFKLVSFDSHLDHITFTCTAIDHSTKNKTEYSNNFLIRVSDKVLIKNRRIVELNVSSLVINNLITLE